MTRVKINGIEYDVNDGIIINQKYNEELDSGTITIPFSDKLTLSPFDFVEIEDERFGNLYFVIDTWVETTVSFNPLKYSYDINLVSETIKLQKIVLPNLAITQPMGKEPKSIWKKIEEYFYLYVYPQYNELTLDPAIYDLLEPCPESVFNRPTFFEVMNTILAKINGIVKVTNHVVGFIKLNEYGEEIDTSKLYYDNNTQTIKDYANRIDVQVTNGVAESKNYSSIAGITVRGGENEAVLNDDNMLILLDKAIYDLGDEAEIYAYVPYKVSDTKKIGKINITDKIVEKAVYDTYLVSVQNEVEGRYKRDALYYVRGNNTIEGLGLSESTILGFSTDVAIYNILRNKLKYIDENAELDVGDKIRDNLYFLVEYKTNESFRFVVEKENDYNATLIDNQSETEVDILNFGKVEQDKLNRLGNKNQIITAVYEFNEKIPKISDYIDKYVLAETEVVYYKDYAVFKGYLYKDYVRKNIFYGLNSKKRSTQIATESVIRNEVFNFDVYFQTEIFGYHPRLARYILQPLALSGLPESMHPQFEGLDYYEYPKYALILTYDEYNNKPHGENTFIVLTPSSFTCGKSNVIQFQFMDNYSAGIKLNGEITGGVKQQYVPYVDNYGEFRYYAVYIHNNKNKDFIENATSVEDLSVYKDIADSLPLLNIEQAQKLVSTTTDILDVSRRIYKDNRETIATTININYKDSENVIIGEFAKYTGIGYRYNIAYYNIGIVYSLEDEYETGDGYGYGELDESLYLDYEDAMNWIAGTGSFESLKLNTGDYDISSWKSWGIVEKDTGKLILGINKGNRDVVPTTIHLKIEEKAY